MHSRKGTENTWHKWIWVTYESCVWKSTSMKSKREGSPKTSGTQTLSRNFKASAAKRIWSYLALHCIASWEVSRCHIMRLAHLWKRIVDIENRNRHIEREVCKIAERRSSRSTNAIMAISIQVLFHRTCKFWLQPCTAYATMQLTTWKQITWWNDWRTSYSTNRLHLMTILAFLGYCSGIMSQIFQGNNFFKHHSPNFDPRMLLPKTSLWSVPVGHWSCLFNNYPNMFGPRHASWARNLVRTASPVGSSCYNFPPWLFDGQSTMLHCNTTTPNKLLQVIHTLSSHGLNSRIENSESPRNHKGLMRQLDFSHHIAEARIRKHHIDLGLLPRTGWDQNYSTNPSKSKRYLSTNT